MINKNQSSFAERLIRRSLTSLGATFDGLFSSKADEQTASTAELVEQLKTLLDKNIREENGEAIAPHLVRVRIEWGTIESADEHPQLRSIRSELLAALITHINDNRYHVYGTPQVEVKPDMLIKGLKMTVGFDIQDFQGGDAAREKVLTLKKNRTDTPETIEEAGTRLQVSLQMGDGTTKNLTIPLKNGVRVSVGRGKDNDLYIMDQSVSKIHAALVFDAENNLKIADTGSTNGTFINGIRISYGKASVINESDEIKFGDVKANFRFELPRVVVEQNPYENIYQQPPNAPEGFQIVSRDSRQIEATQQFNNTQQFSAAPEDFPVYAEAENPSRDDQPQAFDNADYNADDNFDAPQTVLNSKNLPDETRVLTGGKSPETRQTQEFEQSDISEKVSPKDLPPTERLHAPSGVLSKIRPETEKNNNE